MAPPEHSEAPPPTRLARRSYDVLQTCSLEGFMPSTASSPVSPGAGPGRWADVFRGPPVKARRPRASAKPWDTTGQDGLPCTWRGANTRHQAATGCSRGPRALPGRSTSPSSTRLCQVPRATRRSVQTENPGSKSALAVRRLADAPPQATRAGLGWPVGHYGTGWSSVYLRGMNSRHQGTTTGFGAVAGPPWRTLGPASYR